MLKNFQCHYCNDTDFRRVFLLESIRGQETERVEILICKNCGSMFSEREYDREAVIL